MNTRACDRRDARTDPRLDDPEAEDILRKYCFSCSQCDASYRTKGFLDRHMQLHCKKVRSSRPHPNDRSRSFSMERSDLAENDELFSCAECGRSFDQKINLTYHMRIHAGQRPYVCTECGAAFSQEINLKYHVRVHNGERPFSCRACRATFKQKSALDNHVRLHNGERPYFCDHCGASFIQKSNLDFHMRKHGVENPPSSKQCKRQRKVRKRLPRGGRREGSSQDSSLTIRAGVQNAAMVFLCAECGRAFSQEPDLDRHFMCHSDELGEPRRERE